LLVGACRENDVDAGHQTAAALSRWLGQAGVRHVRLDNLPTQSLVSLVGETLRANPDAAAGLVELIEPSTSGNPFETVELLNTLRRDGLLTAMAAGGWRWGHRGRARPSGQVRDGPGS